jgi:transposase-like protein
MAMKDFASLYELFEAIPDEKAAVAYFKAIRWAKGEFCSYCGHDKVYALKGDMAWKCAQCRQRFSMRVGTIFEDSKIPLRKWLAAIWLITSHRKGIASAQLARDIAVTQKTGWFMLHRLRHAARTRSFNRQMGGTVEVDEGYFGGKDGNKHRSKRGKDKKAIAVGLLERGGELRVVKVEKVSEMRRLVIENVKQGSRLMTDETRILQEAGLVYKHTAVNHGRGQYGDGGDGHTNSIEGLWALVKRQIYGIHHWVSSKHLDRYLAEITWRYNRRSVKDGNRIAEFLKRIDGRLTYAALIQKG